MIYFIRSGEYVKIGRASDPWIRFADLQTASAEPLEMLACGVGDEDEERRLHLKFADYHVRGEWYQAAEPVLNYALELKVQRPFAAPRVGWQRVHSFEGLSRFDAVALVTNTAIGVRSAGHDLIVRHAAISGKRGILIFAPGFELIDGDLRLVATETPEVTEVVQS